eukprot:SAG11_NODE_3921_length_2148_cov_2.032211_2_plen_145_part_00
MTEEPSMPSLLPDGGRVQRTNPVISPCPPRPRARLTQPMHGLLGGCARRGGADLVGGEQLERGVEVGDIEGDAVMCGELAEPARVWIAGVRDGRQTVERRLLPRQPAGERLEGQHRRWRCGRGGGAAVGAAAARWLGRKRTRGF